MFPFNALMMSIEPPITIFVARVVDMTRVRPCNIANAFSLLFVVVLRHHVNEATRCLMGTMMTLVPFALNITL